MRYSLLLLFLVAAVFATAFWFLMPGDPLVTQLRSDLNLGRSTSIWLVRHGKSSDVWPEYEYVVAVEKISAKKYRLFMGEREKYSNKWRIPESLDVDVKERGKYQSKNVKFMMYLKNPPTESEIDSMAQYFLP